MGGYRILRNGTVAMGGSIFPPQNCPPGSFAREITLTQDSTERLSSMSFRCSDPENTVITEVAGNGDPATGPQVPQVLLYPPTSLATCPSQAALFVPMSLEILGALTD